MSVGSFWDHGGGPRGDVENLEDGVSRDTGDGEHVRFDWTSDFDTNNAIADKLMEEDPEYQAFKAEKQALKDAINAAEWKHYEMGGGTSNFNGKPVNVDGKGNEDEVYAARDAYSQWGWDNLWKFQRSDYFKGGKREREGSPDEPSIFGGSGTGKDDVRGHLTQVSSDYRSAMSEYAALCQMQYLNTGLEAIDKEDYIADIPKESGD